MLRNYRKRISSEKGKKRGIQGKGGISWGKIPEDMPLIQSSDERTDLESQKNILLR